jgi:hypothetical protein
VEESPATPFLHSGQRMAKGDVGSLLHTLQPHAVAPIVNTTWHSHTQCIHQCLACVTMLNVFYPQDPGLLKKIKKTENKYTFIHC